MCCISMPLHLYTVMSRIPALIATHANRWFIIGGSEEKIKIKKSILLQTLDWPLDVDKYGLTVVHTCRYAILFFFFVGITGYMKVHVAYILHTCIDMSYLQVLNFEFIGYVTIREKN